MRSKSVGTSDSLVKNNQNTNNVIATHNSASASKNTQSSQAKSTFFSTTQSAPNDDQSLRRDLLHIQISEFHPIVNSTEKSKIQIDSEEQKFLVSPQKMSLGQMHQAMQMKSKRQCNLKSRVKSNDLSTNTNNFQIAMQNQSELTNTNKCRENDNSSQKKLSSTKINFNLKYFFKQPQEAIENKHKDSCLNKEQTPLKSQLFSTTSTNLRFQKYNILNNQNRQSQKGLVTPSLQLNKQKISIPKCLLPIQQQNILSPQILQKSPFEKIQLSEQKIREKNLQFKSNVKEEKVDQSTSVKQYFYNSFLFKRPKNNINSQQDFNNLSQKTEKTSIINNTLDGDEIKPQAQTSEIPNDLFSQFKVKGLLMDLGSPQRQKSCQSKISSNFSQTHEHSEIKSPNQTSFSQSSLLADSNEIRSLSRLNLRKGQLSQESASSLNTNQNTISNNRRQLSLKDRLVTINEQDTKQTDLLSPKKNQICISPKTPTSTWQEKNVIPLESPTKRQNLPPSPLSISPISNKRKMYDLQLIDSINQQNKDQISNSQQGNQIIASEQTKNGSKVQVNKKINFKFSKIKSQIESLIPITLKRIVEKPFKHNIEVIKFGLSRSNPQGPKININEFEIFQIFIRIIDHYDTAVKNGNDAFRKIHSIQNQLQERLIQKITSVQDAIKTIIKIKYGCSKISKIVYRLFEGISHLRFIFFEAEILSPEKVALLEMQTREDSVPPLISDVSSKILADRLYHNNFRQFFTPNDFDILIEYIILPDLGIIVSRIENYVNNFYEKRMNEISTSVEQTMKEMFTKQTEYVHTKKNPQKIREVLENELPSFQNNRTNFTNTFYKKMNQYESKTNQRVKKSESQFQLNGQMDNLVQGLQKTLKKYEISSPFSQDIYPELKQQLVKMYNTTSKEI